MTDNRTTELLRKLLDERGVEYEAYRDVMNRCITKWRTYHGAFVFFAVEKEGKLFVETASDTEHSAICTPEQAIAATLGGGECEFSVVKESIPGIKLRGDICECGNCGYRCPYGLIEDERFKCCPGCGARMKAVKR